MSEGVRGTWLTENSGSYTDREGVGGIATVRGEATEGSWKKNRNVDF